MDSMHIIENKHTPKVEVQYMQDGVPATKTLLVDQTIQFKNGNTVYVGKYEGTGETTAIINNSNTKRMIETLERMQKTVSELITMIKG